MSAAVINYIAVGSGWDYTTTRAIVFTSRITVSLGERLAKTRGTYDEACTYNPEHSFLLYNGRVCDWQFFYLHVRVSLACTLRP
jgi:hypothetical protein